MKVILRNRDSGKAKELLTFARTNHAAVLTKDKNAFKVKAKGYGFTDVDIIDYSDLSNDTFSLGKPIVVHNADKVLFDLLNKYYGIEMIGFSATMEE